MPVLNAAVTLPAALDSIEDQTFTDWELIAVDDGSTDASAGLLEERAASDRRVRVLRQAPSGIVESLHLGCSAARGSLIARMDADDVMHPQRLEHQVRFLELNGYIGLVSCLVKHGGHSEAQAGYAIHVDWINSLLTPEQISLRRFVESPVAHPSVMFRRELLEERGGYRAGDFPEDYELWLRWLDAGVRFGKVDAVLLTWNDSSKRVSRVDPRYSVEAFYRTKSHYLARWLRQNVSPERSIWLWGAGRVTRKRFAGLEGEGITIQGYIDVDPLKIGSLPDGRKVVSSDDLPLVKDAFILSGVGVRGAREQIIEHLQAGQRTEGVDYLLVA